MNFAINTKLKLLFISMLAVFMLSGCGGGNADEDGFGGSAVSGEGEGGGSEGGGGGSEGGGGGSGGGGYTPPPPPSGNASATIYWTIPTTRVSGAALALSELSKYVVLLGTSPGNYSATKIITNSTQTTHTFTGLAQGTYYLAVRAVDTSGQASGISEVQKYAN